MQPKSMRGVQQEEVDAAADALLGESQRPTIERVRQRLGRGSPNSLAPMLEVWFAGLAARLGVSPKSDIGAPPAAAKTAFATIWQSALAIARQEAGEALQAERDALALLQAETVHARADLEQERVAFAGREQVLKQNISVLQSQLQSQATEAERLQSEVVARDKRLTEINTSIVKLTLDTDVERRRLNDMVESQARERETLVARSIASEHRLLEEVDRSRQAAKLAEKALQDLVKLRDEERQIYLRSSQETTLRLHAAEIEARTLQASLHGVERRLKDQRMLSAKPKSRFMSKALTKQRQGNESGH